MPKTKPSRQRVVPRMKTLLIATSILKMASSREELGRALNKVLTDLKLDWWESSAVHDGFADMSRKYKDDKYNRDQITGSLEVVGTNVRKHPNKWQLSSKGIEILKVFRSKEHPNLLKPIKDIYSKDEIAKIRAKWTSDGRSKSEQTKLLNTQFEIHNDYVNQMDGVPEKERHIAPKIKKTKLVSKIADVCKILIFVTATTPAASEYIKNEHSAICIEDCRFVIVVNDKLTSDSVINKIRYSFTEHACSVTSTIEIK